MQSAVDARDATQLGALFDDEFKFKTCNGYEDKAAAIAKIMEVPWFISISLKFVSSQFQGNRHVEAVVDIVSFKGTERTMFILDLTKNALVLGRLPNC
ncbi:hypothetical protein B9Z55_000078 [Caenorhabditis nigoni]|nr:hypothetical protein B9Z55_000078 [Caenorhabditis nigoni]